MKFINYTKKHLNECIKLVEDTWHYNEIYSDGVSELLLRTKLEYSNYKKLLIEKNEIIGFILAKEEKKTFKTKIKEFFIKIKNRLWVKTRKGKENDFDKFLSFKNGYSHIDKLVDMNKEDEIDAEITLLIVKGNQQGKGIGKFIIEHFKKHCKKHGIRHVILWTDYDCNFKFYEKLGCILYGSFTNNALSGYNKDEPNGLIYYMEVKDE